MSLEEENRTLRRRLTVAEAFVRLTLLAYDALLHHGVNFRDLKEYKDSTALDDAQKLPGTHGLQVAVEWVRKVENAINAAVRRTQFRVHDNPPPKSK